MIQLNLEKAIAEFRESGTKRLFVQIPEGLKPRTEEISSLLNDFETIISMDPCFGACDLKEAEAKRLGCDAILHLGHSIFMPSEMKVIYAPLPYPAEGTKEMAEKIFLHLKEKNIRTVSLTTTVQFLGHLPKLKEKLSEKGIEAKISSGENVCDGQVLGCNFSAADSDREAVVYFGDGRFHPLGIAFSSQKEVVVANPFTKEVFSLEKEKEDFLKQRISLIAGAREMEKFGILVSTKPGQARAEKAFEAKQRLEENGKKAVVYSADLLSPQNLLGSESEAFINTACPRIAVDDFKNYRQIVLNYYELDYFFGKSFEDYEIPKRF